MISICAPCPLPGPAAPSRAFIYARIFVYINSNPASWRGQLPTGLAAREQPDDHVLAGVPVLGAQLDEPVGVELAQYGHHRGVLGHDPRPRLAQPEVGRPVALGKLPESVHLAAEQVQRRQLEDGEVEAPV